MDKQSKNLKQHKSKKKLYHQLLKVTTENYLLPKLKLCLAKSDEYTHYVYRYKRLFDKTENHFENILNSITVKDNKYKIDTINGTNMSLDRVKLRELLKA